MLLQLLYYTYNASNWINVYSRAMKEKSGFCLGKRFYTFVNLKCKSTDESESTTYIDNRDDKVKQQIIFVTLKQIEYKLSQMTKRC